MIFLLRQYFRARAIRRKLARIERENNWLLRKNGELLARHNKLKAEAMALLDEALRMDQN